jgi:predicted nucleic acid-binding Zn ribbon protein
MEEEYYGLCDNCDVETQVMVMNEEEPPLYCPMCGCGLEFEALADE